MKIPLLGLPVTFTFDQVRKPIGWLLKFRQGFSFFLNQNVQLNGGRYRKVKRPLTLRLRMKTCAIEYTILKVRLSFRPATKKTISAAGTRVFNPKTMFRQTGRCREYTLR